MSSVIFKSIQFSLSLLMFFVIFCYVGAIYAQTSSGTDVSATVGDYYLYVSGSTQAQATVTVQTTNGQQLAQAQASINGTFSFSQILINSGFNSFCVKAQNSVAVSSTICFSFPLAVGDIRVENIFIPLAYPPGAQGSQVPLASGKTVPGSRVTLQLFDGNSLQTNADSFGSYEFFSRGSIVTPRVPTPSPTSFISSEVQPSLSPFVSRSPASELIEEIKENSFPVGLITLLFILILLIILLLIFRKKVRSFFERFAKKSDKLHHSWWIGY